MKVGELAMGPRGVLLHVKRVFALGTEWICGGGEGGAGKPFFQLAVILANAPKPLVLKRYKMNSTIALSRSKSWCRHFRMYALGTGKSFC